MKYNDNNNETIIFNNSNIIKKISNNYIKIDWELYKILLDKSIEDENLIDIQNIKRLIQIYKNKKKKNPSEISLTNKLNNLYNHITFYETYKDYTGELYFAFSFDFRGRLYADHTVSYTNSKITRNSIIYNYSENTEIEDNNDIDKIITDKLNILKKYQTYQSLSNNNLKIIFWILISLGFSYRNKNIKSHSFNSLIETAINNLNNNENSLETLKLKYIHNFYINNNNTTIIHTIAKDATASGLQHIARITNNNNKKTLKYLNMNDTNEWHDTYAYIIDNFLNTHKINNQTASLLTRSTLKKTIMIENYGATETKCLQEFLNTIQKTNNIHELKYTFKQFFKYLRSNDNNKNKLINFDLKHPFNNIILNDAIINITYYKKDKKQISLIYNKKRTTLQELITSSSKIDIRKSNNSFKANITHANDAEIVRRMIIKSNFPIHTIHDCYIIPINKTSYFIDTLNKEMSISSHNNSQLNFKALSPFIII